MFKRWLRRENMIDNGCNFCTVSLDRLNLIRNYKNPHFDMYYRNLVGRSRYEKCGARAWNIDDS